MITFSYCLDAGGNLIRLELNKHQESLIPGAVHLVTTSSELVHPRPWTKTQADAIKEVRFVPRPHVLGTAAQAIHESGNLPQARYVFVPPSGDYASDEQIMEMIALFDELPKDHDGRVQIIEELAKVGVEQIPQIATFWPELHLGSTTTVVSAYVKPGWISNLKVYRKASVA